MVFIFLIIAIHLFLLSKLIFFPYPELFVYSYLTDIGLIPYKEIFDQHFPGIMFFPVNLASLGLNSIWGTRSLQFIVVAVVHVFIYKIAKGLSKDKIKMFVPNLLYLMWQPFYEGYVLWIDTLVAPILLITFYFLVKKRKDLFLAGFFMGLALLFKQVVAPLIIFLGSYMLIKKEYRKIIDLSLGIAIPVSLLLLWVYVIGIWPDFYYWTFLFNVTDFSDMGRKYATVNELIKISPFLGLTIILLLLQLKKKTKDKTLAYLCIYFISLLAFSYARFDLVHLQPVLPIAALTIFYVVKDINLISLRKLFLLYVIISGVFLVRFYSTYLGSEVLFRGEAEKEISRIVLDHSDPGDSVFAFATTPHLYYLTDTHPPGNVFVFQFPWFMKVVEERIYEGIIKDPPKVVVNDPTAQVAGMNLTNHMPEIKEHVDRYYEEVETVGDIKILKRK